MATDGNGGCRMSRVEENKELIKEIYKIRESNVRISPNAERNEILLDISKSLAIIACAIDNSKEIR